MGMGGPVIVEQVRPMGMGMGGGVVIEEIRPMGMGGAVIVEEVRPHVKPMCFRCNNTHRGPCGKPWNCHHCVCIKCHGTGWNAFAGHKCHIMETTM